MTAQVFVDTNVLIYAASSRRAQAAKKAKAIEIITSGEFGVSGQVLAEFYVNVTRKGAAPMAVTDALQWIEAFELQPCVSIDAPLVKRGIEISETFQISYWDAAVVAAAEALGASTLYTEDLNDGQTYGAVRVVNPFKRL